MTAKDSGLEKLAERAKSFIEEQLEIKEQDTKVTLVEPLLQWLGWHILDPHEVSREWRRRRKDNPADYALFADDRDKPVLLIEAKTLGDPLENDAGWKQLVNNGVDAGIRWCARMNGRLVVLVNLLHEAPREKKIFWEVDLSRLGEPGEMSFEQAVEHLELLSKEALSSGRTNRAWDEHQARMKIDTAIETVLGEPPDFLIDTIWGHTGDSQISRELVAKCLAEIVGKGPPPPPPGPPDEKPPILYTGWRLDGDTLYVSKTNKQRTSQWEEKLSLQDFESLARAACQLAAAHTELTSVALCKEAAPADPDQLFWQANQTIGVLHFAGLVSYIGGKAPRRWSLNQGLTAQGILATVTKAGQAGEPLHS